jgi:hypothetical protein
MMGHSLDIVGCALQEANCTPLSTQTDRQDEADVAGVLFAGDRRQGAGEWRRGGAVGMRAARWRFFLSETDGSRPVALRGPTCL